MQKINLNFHVYPLVVGQLDKHIFSDWQAEGGHIQLRATQPADGTSIEEEQITWTSSDPDVAVVSENGLVRALTTGITNITAALPDGSSDTCRIQVIDNIARQTVLFLCLNTDRLVLAKKEGAALYPQMFPVDYFGEGHLDTICDWESSDESIVKVNHRGHMLAVGEGEAVVTARSKDYGREASCRITVVKKSEAELYQDPLEDIYGGSITLDVRSETQLTLPKQAEGQPVCWCTENPAIASVNANGRLTAWRTGSVRVWATFINGGWRAAYGIHVKEKKQQLTEIHLSTQLLSMQAGKSQPVYAVVFPATVLNHRLVWKSSDEEVAQITDQYLNVSGLDEVMVTGKKEGMAVLTATDEETGMSVSCAVAVLPHEIKTEEIPAPGTLGVMTRVSTENAAAAGPNWATGDEEGADPYLSNLHIPAETVTDDSVCLLWNRKSLADLPDFSHYEIYQDGTKIAETTNLSCRIRNLQPERVYTFTVTAVKCSDAVQTENKRKEQAGQNEACSMTCTVTTKPAPTAVLDVTKAPYFAKGDGVASDTYVLQKAIDDCPEGGEVWLPAGYVFSSGALFLKSNMTLRVDGILFGTEDPEEYPLIVCRWEGYRKLTLTEEWNQKLFPVFPENNLSHASLINIGVYDEGQPGEISHYHTKNVRICGNGMINGNGFTLSYNEGPCWYTLRKGLPIPQSPVHDQNIRGRLIAMYNTQGAYICDVTVGYGASWTIQPVFSDAVTFDHVNIISMSDGRTGATEGMLTLNGDGIDPDSSTNINIINCYFTVGDDAVAIKSGRNRQGWQLAKPSAYIRVTDSVCVDAKGSFAIGSESAGDVHHVLFQNLYAANLTNFGLWIKSAPCRGGVVHDVIMRDCVLKNTGGAAQIEYNHGGDEDAAPELPDTHHVTMENIRFEGRHKFALRLIGHPDSRLHDITLRHFTYGDDFFAKRERKFYVDNCKNVRLPEEPLPAGYAWEITSSCEAVGPEVEEN